MDNRGDILQLCRLCLVKDDVNIPIFEEQGDIRQIFLKISSCLPVKVDREDKLPKKICDGCSYKLDMFYDFWNSTANAEKQLMTWLGEAGMTSKMTDGTIAAVTQQAKPNETVVKQEELDPSDIHTEENDDKSYMFHQKFSEDEPGPSATTINDEPPPKRARRTAAVKAQIAMDPESDDDEDSGEPLTKVEDESEESEGEDHDPNFVDVPSTSADDQPGPSGVGKDGDAPCQVSRKKSQSEGLFCKVCLIEYTSEDLKKHAHKLHEMLSKEYVDTMHTCSTSKLVCELCNKSLKSVNKDKHKCIYTIKNGHIVTLKKSEYYKGRSGGMKIAKLAVANHNKLCNNKPNLTEHHRSLICKRCGFQCTDRDNHLFHMKEHEARKKRTRTYSCKECDTQFEARNEYRRHRNKVHDRKVKICFKCGKPVKNLNEHINAVHGNPDEVQCSECGKTFTCKKHLTRHKLVHSNEFKHKCSTCGKGFKTPFSLKVHKRSHDVVKPFECRVCLKTFTTKQWRDNHLKTH